jgi:hypothetical protein
MSHCYQSKKTVEIVDASLSRGLVDSNGNTANIPDFTLQELLNCIPKHCYEKSAFLGFIYVLRDIGCLVGNFYLCHSVMATEVMSSLPTLIKIVIWATYTFAQGLLQLVCGLLPTSAAITPFRQVALSATSSAMSYIHPSWSLISPGKFPIDSTTRHEQHWP